MFIKRDFIDWSATEGVIKEGIGERCDPLPIIWDQLTNWPSVVNTSSF